MPSVLPTLIAREILLTKTNLELLNAIVDSGFEPKLVGGCVRDAFLGEKSSDIDIASTAPPEQTIKALKTLCVNKINTFAARYGVICARYKGMSFQISTLREDVKTYGRNADVMFTKLWDKDAKRRDFTINSIYMSPYGDLLDPYDGVNDLNNGHVKFIGNPSVRIQEDYIRILRYFRFWGRFSKHKPDDNIIKAISKRHSGLKTLSQALIFSEMRKIKKLSNCEQVLSLMDDLLGSSAKAIIASC
ncbi:MAG: hypothetical protein LBI30_00580 [Holosporales bacterium]|jgi:tRNA nucleotidyltransferase/poly(A) polymerase|nr:hypothetical protein [Holosporales bacterium]